VEKVRIQQDNCSPFSARTATDRERCSNAHYVAALSTRLALERWTKGGDIPHVYSYTRHVPTRAAWYAQAENQFQAWLEKGGFHAK
jgi:hypothetical protein